MRDDALPAHVFIADRLLANTFSDLVITYQRAACAYYSSNYHIVRLL